MTETIWVIANWKSNKNISEALEWIAQVGPNVPKKDNLKIVVCPTFSALSEVKKAIMVGNFPLLVGAQDLSSFPTGAYTGEEPAELLTELVSLAILGHSERRQNFSETDAQIAEKVDQAQASQIIPLVCVQGPDTPVPVNCQLVAYEPIFAIGTGNPDTPENANRVAASLKQKYGQELEVIYGGSVALENIKSFVSQSEINGVLIGKKSLDASEFTRICKIIGEMI